MSLACKALPLVDGVRSFLVMGQFVVSPQAPRSRASASNWNDQSGNPPEQAEPNTYFIRFEDRRDSYFKKKKFLLPHFADSAYCLQLDQSGNACVEELYDFLAKRTSMELIAAHPNLAGGRVFLSIKSILLEGSTQYLMCVCV